MGPDNGRFDILFRITCIYGGGSRPISDSDHPVDHWGRGPYWLSPFFNFHCTCPFPVPCFVFFSSLGLRPEKNHGSAIRFIWTDSHSRVPLPFGPQYLLSCISFYRRARYQSFDFIFFAFFLFPFHFGSNNMHACNNTRSEPFPRAGFHS